MWRLHKGILPTRKALARRCNIMDTSCPFCGLHVEDDLHVLKECKRVEEFWLCGPLNIKVRTLKCMSISAWILHACDSLPKDKWDWFYMLLWALWHERNGVVWKGNSFCPLNIVGWASKLLDDYHKAHPVSRKNKSRPQVKWKLPPRGRLKLNTDGAFHGATGHGGIEAVIRNEDGECLAAIARPFSRVRSAFQMEVEAMRAGLLLLIHQGMDSVDIETDCAAVSMGLHINTEDLSEVGCIVEDCKAYLSSLSSFTLRSI
ncbi:uncharacterized protein LOC112178196 [Rosa chinensis]|uniref:uncharacterized protein LOC112178196 n=1 Tax=Rosa chinensis TaxID=74649 RepID=UPI000D08D2E7|nr:uncharacterized protein LOC112178196 [Rosa chinensis]